MKWFITSGVGLAVVMAATSVRATDLQSGPQPGDRLGGCEGVKVAGAPEDGVAVGQELCYRSKLGNRPVVMVFSRKPDRALAHLVQRLDSAVVKNRAERNMASFVSLLGEKPEELASASKTIVKDTHVANVAFVVA